MEMTHKWFRAAVWLFWGVFLVALMARGGWTVADVLLSWVMSLAFLALPMVVLALFVGARALLTRSWREPTTFYDAATGTLHPIDSGQLEPSRTRTQARPESR